MRFFLMTCSGDSKKLHGFLTYYLRIRPYSFVLNTVLLLLRIRPYSFVLNTVLLLPEKFRTDEFGRKIF